MPPWAPGQQLTQPVYDRYNPYVMQAGGYPNASASGSPMNYGAYYPPTSFAPSPAYNMPSSSPAYRGGFPTTTGYGVSQAHTSTTGPPHGQHSTSGATTYSANSSGPATSTNSGTSGPHGNGYTATSGASHNASYDPAILTAAMQSMSFGSK